MMKAILVEVLFIRIDVIDFTNLIDVIKVTFRIEVKNINEIRKMIFYFIGDKMKYRRPMNY